jgi:hypothetical protein
MRGLFAVLAVPALMLTGCGAPPGAATATLGVSVDSWELVPVDELNARIEAAEAAGLDWPRHAIGAALAALEYGLDARYVELTAAGNRGEVADTVVVVVGRDRFKDDSIRGDWHRAVLYRTSEGTWRFGELRRAFRCYRGKASARYWRDHCP